MQVYPGYVLITMQHLIVNTITGPQSVVLILFIEVVLYFNEELWMSPFSCISIEEYEVQQCILKLFF